MKNRVIFLKGVKDGIPIALSYFAVAFSLGIMAKRVGLTPLQGFISSILNHASAGEYAEFTVIAANAPYVEMAFVILVTNARYLLMSCALSQKFSPTASVWHRILVGFGISDEIFGISIAQEGYLNPFYTYGAIVVALPSWALGTTCGIIAGNILPAAIVNALSVALYGMFLAIIIPPAKKDKVVLGTIVVSFFLSYVTTKLELFASLSESLRVVLLTVLIAGLSAVIFPVREEEEQ